MRDVALFSEVVTGKAKGVTRPDSPIMISSDEEEARVISISSDIESEEEMEEKKEEERKRKHESGYEEREANGEF